MKTMTENMKIVVVDAAVVVAVVVSAVNYYKISVVIIDRLTQISF